ncbi:hypothetical protein OG874_11110 [Nocardia sp. NBC_00565]|uniref:hypothetical protein n=1 Tax=Nocardia sp. NBC_00565 TaxID=2975993 RepID=UPI002E80E349|nr:hypothetical protein [Nocardia sp. NBC_00565]WUC05650.1 hypothetical protein OG874_11110 [Nocardia sp. NBC_00565]
MTRSVDLTGLSAKLGPEGAVVEFMLATYGTGTRVKAARGDLAAAETRLAQGAAIAENLGLARLSAWIVNEKIRIGLPWITTARPCSSQPSRDAPNSGCFVSRRTTDRASTLISRSCYGNPCRPL